MSAVVIACVALSALALVLASALLLSVRANRRRTAELEFRIAGLAQRVVEPPRSAAPEPPVHVLQPLERDDEQEGILVPTTAQVVDATLGRPLVRAATLSHGLRRALRPESRDRIAGLVRREFRRRRRVRLRAGRRAARLAVVPPQDRAVQQERAS